jgi:predicted nuclease with TOPRIM domain
MQLNKELEKLRADKAKAEKELEYLQHDMQRLQNRLGYLEKGERQKRAHRLITKGAAIESLAPTTKEMGETDFFSLMEKILALPDVLALLPKEDAE